MLTYVVSRKRTTVFADEEDLAVLKAVAARRGVAEAELIRAAIHLAAMANRTWTEPFFSQTYVPSKPSGAPRVGAVVDDVWAEEVDAYERTKSRPR